jgi:hypothetical protein
MQTSSYYSPATTQLQNYNYQQPQTYTNPGIRTGNTLLGNLTNSLLGTNGTTGNNFSRYDKTSELTNHYMGNDYGGNYINNGEKDEQSSEATSTQTEEDKKVNQMVNQRMMNYMLTSQKNVKKLISTLKSNDVDTTKKNEKKTVYSPGADYSEGEEE